MVESWKDGILEDWSNGVMEQSLLNPNAKIQRSNECQRPNDKGQRLKTEGAMTKTRNKEGKLECRKNGVMEYWSDGVLEGARLKE
jgi:hypothetical protein